MAEENSNERDEIGGRTTIGDCSCEAVDVGGVARDGDGAGEVLPKLELKKMIDRALPPHDCELLPVHGT